MKIESYPELRETILGWLAQTYRETLQLHRPEGWHITEFIYCLHPETLVLKSNLNWQTIGSLVVGDELIGIEEHSRRRHMQSTTVTGIGYRKAPCYKLYLSNGIEIIASEEHPWLAQAPCQENTKWRRTDTLIPGSYMSYNLGHPWVSDNDYCAGYLAGSFDGEGYVSSKVKGAQLVFTQRDNEMLQTVVSFLEEKGFPLHIAQRKWDGIYQVYILGIPQMMRFLGSFTPKRLSQKATEVWFGKEPRRNHGIQHVRLERKEKVGAMDVVSIETTTHTFNAMGCWTHNCLSKAYWERTDPLPPSDKELLFFVTGLGMEKIMIPMQSKVEPMLVEGIWVSPDFITDIHAELKSTRIGVKRLEARDIPETWVTQIKCYCYATKQLTYPLAVLSIIPAEMVTMLLTFIPEEIEQCWYDMKERGVILSDMCEYDEWAKDYPFSNPQLYTCENSNPWECEYCRYNIRCRAICAEQGQKWIESK